MSVATHREEASKTAAAAVAAAAAAAAAAATSTHSAAADDSVTSTTSATTAAAAAAGDPSTIAASGAASRRSSQVASKWSGYWVWVGLMSAVCPLDAPVAKPMCLSFGCSSTVGQYHGYCDIHFTQLFDVDLSTFPFLDFEHTM